MEFFEKFVTIRSEFKLNEDEALELLSTALRIALQASEELSKNTNISTVDEAYKSIPAPSLSEIAEEIQINRSPQSGTDGAK
jgi:20S proteasome alpha/beta subunit